MQVQSHLFTSQGKEGIYRNMATGPPQPNQIPNFPSGELHFLFRKKITRSDMQPGLILIRESNEYLRSLPQAMRDQINAFGLATMCYTPFCNYGLGQVERMGLTIFCIIVIIKLNRKKYITLAI